jgi:hypothetical protein
MNRHSLVHDGHDVRAKHRQCFDEMIVAHAAYFLMKLKRRTFDGLLKEYLS